MCHGVAFDPSSPPDLAVPCTLDDAKIGGLGIHLLHKFSHAVRYERRENKNHLTLEFLL
jgi:serine/threonine-protein kinase RsbW